MSRLQVLLEDAELHEIRQVAKARGMTVSEWVRQALREARRRATTGDPLQRLRLVRASARHAFPTADIDRMLDEIESGYSGRRG